MEQKYLDKLSADILDDDFVEIFRSIHLTQWLLGTLQVKIRYGFVSKTSFGYEVFCIFVWLVHTVSLFVFIIHCESSNHSMLTDFYLKLSHILMGLIIAAVTVHNFCKGNANTNFYVSLQKIDRDLGMKDASRRNKQVSLLTKISVAVTIISSITWSLVSNFYSIKDFCPAALILQIPVLSNYIEMILIFFKIYFIVIRIQYINSILKERVWTSSCHSEYSGNTIFITNNCFDSEDKLWNRLVTSLQNIISAMEELHDIHQFTIFGMTCEFMIIMMILVQSMISTIKQQIPINIYSITVVVPAIMFLLFIMLLCIVAELLKSKMDQSRKLCANVLCVSKGASRQNIKRLLLLLDVKKTISIYDIYTLDGQLPLNLLAITATYTIVLLQFALL